MILDKGSKYMYIYIIVKIYTVLLLEKKDITGFKGQDYFCAHLPIK